MKHQSTKDFSTVSTLGVENTVENVETVKSLKDDVENSKTKIPFYGAEVDSSQKNEKE